MSVLGNTTFSKQFEKQDLMKRLLIAHLISSRYWLMFCALYDSGLNVVFYFYFV